MTRALIHHDFESVPVAQWQSSTLAAYVFRQTSAEYRKPLLPHFAQAMHRWKTQETELRSLLQAWNEAGIVPLLIKGVAMAIQHYPQPHERFFGDIDLVIERKDVPTARDIAARLGWLVLFDENRDQSFTMHEALGLVSPKKNIKLDVHHHVLKHPAKFAGHVRALQEKLTEHLEVFDWNGIKVHLLGPADAALVPLILHRAWYRDRWQLKRFDYLDLEMLKQQGLTREALLERAAALGCQTTAELFLQRCDPWEKRLTLTPLTAAELQQWNMAISAERGYTSQQGEAARKARIQQQFPQMLGNVLTGLGWVLKAALVLQRQQSLQALCNRVPLKNQPPALQELWKARIGVLGASKLLARFPRGGSGMCVLRALSMLWWLRQAGIDAELVSGVRNVNGTLKGHAWIEYQGTVIAVIAEDNISPMVYKVNFRSASAGNSPQTQGAGSVPEHP